MDVWTPFDGHDNIVFKIYLLTGPGVTTPLIVSHPAGFYPYLAEDGSGMAS